ncbi:DUF4382 domain-containing protein [Reichenbachiella sp. MALMAid0571]|uniref:DUF4382 domain-containing protein n=1 Tax=Reichenbachiella sp. MALMAid0571 TaxID=3143939 RepID=UPI0032DFC950
MKNLKLSIKILGVVLMAGLFACNDGDDPSFKGRANVKATDAAVDAENVSAVYLSVSEIQATANGQTKTVVSFNTPKKFNIMAYQNGATYLVGDGELDAGSYSDLRFITSGGSDSYIEFDDGSTENLVIENGTTTGYRIQGAFEIATNTTTDLVADIDLRKALVATSDGSFKLRSTARVVAEDNTGKIEGTVSQSAEASERMVVYAYESGTFSASEENAPADGNTRYEGSINSAIVSENGSYTLAFMEEGDYEIIVAKYTNQDDDEDMEFEGRLNSSIMINGSLFNKISVTSNTTISANLLIN